MSRICPCCAATQFKLLLDFGRVPVSGCFRADPMEPLVSVPLAFELCGSCGMVRQYRAAAERDYSDMTRSTTRQFPAYGDELITNLKTLGVGPDDLVLEVGSNDGSVLERMRGAGFRQLVGIEPSYTLAEEGRRRGFMVVNDYFGPGIVASLVAAHGPAQAIICRHTLEHVPDPLGFVTALAECLDPQGGTALVEVPDSAVIPEQMNIYEFWDEHMYYFVAENLMLLLSRVGMVVRRLERNPHLDTRNLLAWFGPGETGNLSYQGSVQPEVISLWQALPAKWSEYRRRFAAAVQLAPRPLYLIGASHPQCNFANYCGIGALLDYFIDDDPEKVGRFPPVAGSRGAIISTTEFEATARSGTVVKTGFGYPRWTARICEGAERHGMETLDPRESFAICP